MFRKKIALVQIILLLLVLVGLFCLYQNIKESAKIQEEALYLVNISGKQRVLAQRIVFLSQVILSNTLSKRDNHTNFKEFRGCIMQLNSIHNVLKEFVVGQISQNKQFTTLDDMYFGGGNLDYRMERFLQEASKVFYLNDIQSIVISNQELLGALEGDNGLLAVLELATLSHQIYAQNLNKSSTLRSNYIILAILILVVCELLLFFIKKRDFKS
ncbi:hypothetical protein B6S12_00800 [Helicobacter valdiviensis]|uniref:NarX-like N-terminal domain-containing protein n=1 Tax=Helicobacter valdiviensis TaxID=1458358 RepID=A0A2W6MXB2_9HELI|nr:hypothetical protein [Helicobacter valdiviensis]PZT49164.1 hypothetical protein B6S12_00800 [Helicobacter valdiviensis]